jgi:putative ABC transport system substrate-binding protein
VSVELNIVHTVGTNVNVVQLMEEGMFWADRASPNAAGQGMKQIASRLPIGLKFAYTAFMAVLIPVYWHYYGPTNFLYFCDVSLILVLIAIWQENALLAADLVRLRVAVIVASVTEATLAAKAATTTIPIVFNTGGDPVALGLVAGLNRPGGNLTGYTSLQSQLVPKRLQLLRELVPNASVFGVLADPAFPDTQSIIADLQTAARTLGLQLIVVNARTDSDLETAFASFSQQHFGAVLFTNNTFFARRTEQLAALAARHVLPAIGQLREFALAGGLMSYGTDTKETYRVLGDYAGRILKGDKPADLPVQQITKIETVINLKTAKALGLAIPETLLATADEVIQ